MAAALCIGAVVVTVVALTSHGPLPDAAATTIPASVKTAMPASPDDRDRPLARSLPMELRIPAIGVRAPIMELGLNANHTVQVPPLNNHNLAGWYEYGPSPGQRGASVILGHVDSVTGVSVFFYLKDLRPGDKIYVTLADGNVATFIVDGLQQASKTAFPTSSVYGRISYPGLRLVTCGGAFDPSTGHYLENIIVYAHLA